MAKPVGICGLYSLRILRGVITACRCCSSRKAPPTHACHHRSYRLFGYSFISPLPVRDFSAKHTASKGSRVCGVLRPHSRVPRARTLQASCCYAHLSAVGRPDGDCIKETGAKAHCSRRHGLGRRALGSMLCIEANDDIPLVPPPRVYAHRAGAYLKRTWLRRQRVGEDMLLSRPF